MTCRKREEKKKKASKWLNIFHLKIDQNVYFPSLFFAKYIPFFNFSERNLK